MPGAGRPLNPTTPVLMGMNHSRQLSRESPALKKTFKPGQTVPQSGDYMMVSETGLSLDAPRYCHAGDGFPPSLRKGVRFRLIRARTEARKKKRRRHLCRECRAKLSATTT
jgi:hypothetical protein